MDIYTVAVKHIKSLPAGDQVLASDIRAEAYKSGIEIMEDRVFGSLMKRLAKEGLIVKAGFTNEGRSHGGVATKWVKRGRM